TVLGADVEIGDILNSLNQVILPGEGYMFIANNQGNIFTHNDSKLLNQPVSKLGLNNNDITNAARSGTERRVSISGTDYVIYARPIEGTKL
ncbi:hypothetical protein WAI99_21360, partial [Acinetobacter baumannii]